MSYVPSNLQVFTAAYSGALAGMVLGARAIQDTNAADYANQATIAGAFAQALDTAWGSSRVATLLDTNGINAACQSYWQQTQPDISAASHYTATRWAGTALTILAPMLAGESYFASQGIVPPAIPGGSPSGGGNFAANLTALAAVPTGALSNGINYFVGTLGTYFSLDSNSTATVDGITIIAAQAGGRWLRNLTYGNPNWLIVQNWFINASIGNDENNGQAQTQTGVNTGPIKTFGELSRRWNNGLLNPPVGGYASDPTVQVCTVNILTDLPASDPVNIFTQIPSNVALWITGALGRTTLYTGTVSSFTALNAATNQAEQLTDTGIGSWTTYLNKRMRITQAGTNNNAISWVAKDLGSNQCRCSVFGSSNYMNGGITNATSFTIKTPAANDTYVIENLPTVTVAVIAPPIEISFAVGSIPLPGSLIIGELVTRTGAGFNIPTSVNNVYAYGMQFGVSVFNTGISFQSCYFPNGLTVTSELNALIVAGMTKGVINSTGALTIVQATLFQAAALFSNKTTICSAQFFDNAAGGSNPNGNGIVLGKILSKPNIGSLDVTVSPLGSDIAATSIMGSGNAGVGIFVPAGCRMGYPTGAVLAVTGTGGDFKLDNGTTSRAWNEATGLYTAALNNTWVLLNTVLGSAGFGGSAHNVQSDAHILLQVAA